MTPAVSIITPTFNHERYIGACLASVRAQSFASWEQIVIDDGSSDRTGAVVEAAGDARVRYVRQERAGLEGLCDTYNRALAMCRAPLVALLEGDDTWPRDKLATLVPAFDAPDVVLAYGLTEVVGEARHDFPPRIPGPEHVYPAGTLTNTPVGIAAAAMLDYRVLTFTYPCSVIVRRSTLERIGGFQRRPGLIVVDHPTFLRLALEGRFHFEPRVMGYWRVHTAGTTLGQMDHILAALRRDLGRTRAELGARLPLSAARWQEIGRTWRTAEGWMSLRRARRLLTCGRWADARPHLSHALAVGKTTTMLAALLGLAGSRLGFSIEPVYRLRGRAWFRAVPGGDVELVP